jgi:hypothetical protein
MARTVLYKVGHHGSHNVTLKGSVQDDYPNLSWTGHGKYASEFTAMITAVNKWALSTPKPPEATLGALRPRTKSVICGIVVKRGIRHVEHRW